MNMLAQMRLLQIASQAIPIGGYSHSHGLEAAIESGLVHDEASVQQWITDMLSFSIGSFEAACLERMSDAWSAQDYAALCGLNEEFLATRESAELRSATVQMGFSMRSLLSVLPDLPHALNSELQTLQEPCLPCVWSGAATAWAIAPCNSLAAYLWSWAENQVLVAMKSVPIGQSSGQRVLLTTGSQIAQLMERRQSGAGTRLSNFVPGLAILSSQHETQYSRLFRS
jgi:urease accessory protein